LYRVVLKAISKILQRNGWLSGQKTIYTTALLIIQDNKLHNMKNKTGIIGGFVNGLAGFLLMFKIIFLVNIPPDDELAPGIVVFASVLNGILFAFIGSFIQDYLTKKRQRSNKT